MAKRGSKRDAILEYIKTNPTAKNAEVAKACGVHPTYASTIRRNDGVKKPKEFIFKSPKFDIHVDMLERINELNEKNASLKDDIVRMSGVIEYLEIKLRHATSV